MAALGGRPKQKGPDEAVQLVLVCWLLLAAGCSWLPHHPPGCSCSACSSAAEPSMADAGRAVDRLASEVDDRGTIVIKRPDVWGDASSRGRGSSSRRRWLPNSAVSAR